MSQFARFFPGEIETMGNIIDIKHLANSTSAKGNLKNKYIMVHSCVAIRIRSTISIFLDLYIIAQIGLQYSLAP